MGDRHGTPCLPEGQVGAAGDQQLGQCGAGGCWDPQNCDGPLASTKRLESGCGQGGLLMAVSRITTSIDFVLISKVILLLHKLEKTVNREEENHRLSTPR